MRRHKVFSLGRIVRLACYAIAVAGGHCPYAQGAEVQQAVADSAGKQVELWVQQLDHDHYDVRERAQRELEQLGQSALLPVVEAASDGTLESVTRAVSILLGWSESEDHDFRLQVLEHIANLPNRPRESAMASRVLAEVRELAALTALKRLGADYERDMRVPGNHLRILFDTKWRGGSEDLRHLADIPRVSSVSFVAAAIDESALDGLANLKNLKRVELYRTPIAKAVADEFDRLHPDIHVDFRRGALLGVKGMPNGPCTINDVEPNSAAERAGITPGDTVTEFNGEAVEDFESLTNRISAFGPGESATLTVVRESEKRLVKVTFGDWGHTQMHKLNRRIQVQIAPNRNRVIQRNPAPNAEPAAPVRKSPKEVQQELEEANKQLEQMKKELGSE